MKPDPNSATGPLPLSHHRINTPHMYKLVFERGNALKSFPLTLRYYFPQEAEEISRVGFIIRKATGKAVARNLLRRILRSAFQHTLPEFGRNTWVVFDVSAKAKNFTRADVRAGADRLLSHIAAEGREGRT